MDDRSSLVYLVESRVEDEPFQEQTSKNRKQCECGGSLSAALTTLAFIKDPLGPNKPL